MLRILFSIGPICLMVGVIAVLARASELPVAQRVAAEICSDPGITAAALGARFAPGLQEAGWQRLRDEHPAEWLHRRFLGSPGNAYWMIVKSRKDGERLARVWVDIGGTDAEDKPVTRASASFDGACRLLDAVDRT